MRKILVAVHSEKVGHFVASALRERGYEVSECWTGTDAIRLFEAQGAGLGLAVVDAALDDIDGFEVCRELRRRAAGLSILMLGTGESAKERVRGFDGGADDFLSRPFVLDELLARVGALLRRSVGHRLVSCGDLEIDRLDGRATVAGRELTLTTRERAVLAHLAEHRGRVVTRLELLTGVWGSEVEHGSNALDVHLSHLRAKLGEHAWMLETVRGKGYRLRGHRGD